MSREQPITIPSSPSESELDHEHPISIPSSPSEAGANLPVSHSTFLSLPNEILLHIADYLIDDYYFWKNTRFKRLWRMGVAQRLCSYYNLACAHPFLYDLLLSQSCPSNIQLWDERRKHTQSQPLLSKLGRKRKRRPSFENCIALNEDFPNFQHESLSTGRNEIGPHALRKGKQPLRRCAPPGGAR